VKNPAYVMAPCPTCGQPRKVRNGIALREMRQRAGLTQRDFGRPLGISSPYVSDIERNRRECPEDVLAAYLALGER